LSIVIPAFNEAEGIEETLRIVIGQLERQPHAFEVLVVDDGSTDATAAIAEACAGACPTLRVIRQPRNLGKGAGVKRGMLEARGLYLFFMDADLAVPIEDLAGAVAALIGGPEPIVIGSRRFHGARIERPQPWVRQTLGSGFTLLARLLISPAIVDFTCGFKGFRRDEARILFALQRCSDWAFDAEILYLARLMDMPVRQYPVRWRHHKNSRVRFPRDIYRTLAALVRIRWRARRSVQYRPEGLAVRTACQAPSLNGRRD
jgi:dolichyl-phosphate beta-glucosyltransferase